MLIIVMTTVVVGLVAIGLAEPRPRHEIVVWNDESERRLLREKFAAGWW